MTDSDEKSQTAFQRELRATSDMLLTSMARLLELETRKRQLLPGSPEFLERAREVEELAATVIELSAHEATLAQDVRDLPLGQAATTPIDRLAPDATHETILREWHAAEQRLVATSPGSADYAAAYEDARRLRETFRRSRG